MGIFTKAVSYLARNLNLTDPRLYSALSTGPTYAGENVSIDGSLNLDTVWANVNTIVDTISTLPCLFYRRDANGNGVIDTSHPLYRMLHDRPNADMTAVDFWGVVVASLLLWGNAYVMIERLGQRIISLVPLRPDRVTVRRMETGALQFTYSWQGQVLVIGETDMLHIKGFSLDGIVGISPISQLRNVVASSIAAEKVSGSFFKNGMQPSKVMRAKEYLTDSQRTQAKAIIEKYSGSIAAGRVPLLEGGWELADISINPADAQLLETKAFQVEQICRIFRMPPPIIGHTEKESAWGPAREQIMIWFVTLTIRPHLKRIEQAVARALLAPDEIDTCYVEFNVEGLLRADSKGRAALYASSAQNGWNTRNEIRRKENLAPVAGGDTLTVQSNLIPIDMLGKVAPSQTPSHQESVDQPIGQ